MEDQLATDLLEILSPSTRADVRGVAVQQLLGMTGTKEGCVFISQHSGLLETVLCLLSDDSPALRKEAVKIVINLTADETTVHAFLQQPLEPSLTKTATFLLEQCLDSEKTDNSMCCILTNLTRDPDGARFVANLLMSSESMGLSWFMVQFSKMYVQKNPAFIAVSTLLMNLTQVECVRRGLLDPPARHILNLLSMMSMSSALSSCKGVVGAVKNCCFEFDYHEWLLGEEVDLLPRLLLPLAGPEEFDEDDMDRLPQDLQLLPDTKEREADPEVRGMLIKAVHKLCSTKSGRMHLKEKNTYVILRELHKWEKCRKNIDAIFDVIDILIGDEPEEGMEDLHSVTIPSDVEDRFLQENQAS